MNNENFAGIMGTVKQAEVTNGVCGYDTENLYVVLRVCVPRKSGAEDTVIVAAKIKENENIDAEAIARNVENGDKYYIRKEYTEVSELGKDGTPQLEQIDGAIEPGTGEVT